MNPERMDQVGEVLEKAIGMEVARRAQYLDEACAGDAELRREVESLIASHEQAGSHFLNEGVVEAFGIPQTGGQEEVRAGRRIGPYLAEREIGHGGMGEVFSAVRADGQYEKKVAVKLVRSGYDTAFILERFRNERQILASLDHPNIARLLDGGTTDEGVPYLVMELVEGAPIDSYCSARALSVSERLQLFLQVCGAVQYAHQRLVIHRDIKPSNILVTQEGVPKLLDFGIAKILDASGSAEATLLRPMTPQYASPEQIRGEPLTTATDVYSLAVVLYQLLTGHSPYRADFRTPARLAEAIAHEEPERPSTSVQHTESNKWNEEPGEQAAELAGRAREVSSLRLQRRLRGDLDFILLKALRKEPSLRYASVGEFAEDIRHHLAGLPVTARKGTWSYRASKFVQRHKAGVAAAVLVLVTLVSGVLVTLREARIAQRRFNDVRALANSLMFEINDAIQDLPGATATRKLLVTKALQYLDSLSQEASGDLSLQHELASAYEKVGDVQGDPSAANLGDTAGALASYRKALAIREAIAAGENNSVDSQRRLAADYQKLGSGLIASGDYRAGLEYAQEHLAIRQHLASLAPGRESEEYLAGAYYLLAWCQMDLGDFQSALTHFQESAAIREGVTDAATGLSPRVQVRLAGTYGRIATVLAHQGHPKEAIARYRQSADILRKLSASDPLNAAYRQYLNECWYYIGFYLSQNGQLNEALRDYRQALAAFEALSAADPKEARAKRFVALCNREIGRAQVTHGQLIQGTESIRKSLSISEELYRSDPAQKSDKLPDLADGHAALGFAYAHAAARPNISVTARLTNWKAARAAYVKSLELWQEAKHRGVLSALDAAEPDRVAEQLVECDARLAKLGRTVE